MVGIKRKVKRASCVQFFIVINCDRRKKRLGKLDVSDFVATLGDLLEQDDDDDVEDDE